MVRTIIYPALLVMIVFIVTACDSRKGRIDLLVGDDSLRGYFSIEADSVTMYASPDDKKSGKIECRIYKQEYDVFVKMFRVLDDAAIREAYRQKGSAPFSPEFITAVRSIQESRFHYKTGSPQTLAGLRIAIDPGHNAGSMSEAIREGKYMWLFDNDGRRLIFHESRLNLATAVLLKDLLERDGAEVMLTRNANRQVYPLAFDNWVGRYFRKAVLDKQKEKLITDNEAVMLLTYAGDRRRLKFFNSEFDMPYRAKLINAFHPDITVLVHYDSNGEYRGYREKYNRLLDILKKNGASAGALMADYREIMDSTAETEADFSTVFVPGCFLRGELAALESRIEFLRLVLSQDINNSIRYSLYVMDNFRKMLDLPPARHPLPGGRKVGICRDGIYARNFRMTRLVRGTLCLGEPLQQNNLREARDLAAISRGGTPERVKAVARAYHEAIRKYAQRHMQ